MNDMNERTVLDPSREGLEGIIDLSSGSYRTNWQALPEHSHTDHLELCFCARGALVYECRGIPVKILPDNLFVVQPRVPHHLVTAHKGMRIHWLSLAYPKHGQTVLDLSCAETKALIAKLRAVPTGVFAVDPAMRQLFARVFRAAKELPDGAFRRLTLRTLLLRILLLTTEGSGNRPSLGSLAKIDRIARMMEKHPAHRYVTAELAAHAKLSASRFTALFRKVKGLPPYAYLTECRLREVKRRLTETDDTVAVIAAALGFSSPQHLATLFRRAFGCTPTDFTASAKRTRSGAPTP